MKRTGMYFFDASHVDERLNIYSTQLTELDLRIDEQIIKYRYLYDTSTKEYHNAVNDLKKEKILIELEIYRNISFYYMQTKNNYRYKKKLRLLNYEKIEELRKDEKYYNHLTKHGSNRSRSEHRKTRNAIRHKIKYLSGEALKDIKDSLDIVILDPYMFK